MHIRVTSRRERFDVLELPAVVDGSLNLFFGVLMLKTKNGMREFDIFRHSTFITDSSFKKSREGLKNGLNNFWNEGIIITKLEIVRRRKIITRRHRLQGVDPHPTSCTTSKTEKNIFFPTSKLCFDPYLSPQPLQHKVTSNMGRDDDRKSRDRDRDRERSSSHRSKHRSKRESVKASEKHSNKLTEEEERLYAKARAYVEQAERHDRWTKSRGGKDDYGSCRERSSRGNGDEKGRDSSHSRRHSRSRSRSRSRDRQRRLRHGRDDKKEQ